MLEDLKSMAGAALMQRATLLLNHVVRAEPAASARLVVHSGRCIRLQFDGWPAVLPAWPPLAFRITPAGLFEWCGADVSVACDLHVSVDASNPLGGALQALAGSRPRVDVSGDAALAADVDWLFDNLRWDVEDDLARLVGPMAAREVGRLGRAVAAGVKAAAQRLGGLAAGRGGGAAGEPARQ